MLFTETIYVYSCDCCGNEYKSSYSELPLNWTKETLSEKELHVCHHHGCRNWMKERTGQKENQMSEARIIPLEEVAARYPHLAELAVIFAHEIVEVNKVWRWKENKLICQLMDHAPVYTPSRQQCDGLMSYCRPHTQEFRASVSLNDLVCDLHKGNFTYEEWMKFYMQMGYSLQGFVESFGQVNAFEHGLEGALTYSEDDDPDEYIETPIEYMIRKYKGQVLKF